MEGDQVTPSGNQDQSAEQSLGWRAALPTELREHEFVKGFTKPGDFVKSALDIKTGHDALKTKLEGAIFRPGETATEAEKADFYKALGRPDKPEGYEIAPPEGLPVTQQDVDWLKNTAHKRGFSKVDAEAFAKDYFEKTKADIETVNKMIEAKRAESVNALKKEWGGEFDAKLDAAKITAVKIGGEEFKTFLNDTGIGDHPQFIKAFHKISTMLSESSFVPGGNPPPSEPKRTEGGMPVLKFASMEKK